MQRQFEFVQRAWVNDANFPCPEAKAITGENNTLLYPNGQQPDGEDPIIAQTKSASFGVPTSGNTVWRPTMSHFVTMTGGDYFFAPSIKALFKIAQVPPPT